MCTKIKRIKIWISNLFVTRLCNEEEPGPYCIPSSALRILPVTVLQGKTIGFKLKMPAMNSNNQGSKVCFRMTRLPHVAAASWCSPRRSWCTALLHSIMWGNAGVLAYKGFKLAMHDHSQSFNSQPLVRILQPNSSVFMCLHSYLSKCFEFLLYIVKKEY
jgi:hypothetical protein